MVKWATHNVGASEPEGYGDYYAWGEIETKTSYTWTNYKFRTSGDSDDNVKKFNKYNAYSDYGIVDNKTTLDPEDDVAHGRWGGNWRMPTKAEQEELHTNCTWTWTTLNGMGGYRLTSNKSGYTDRSIFLPAAGGWLDEEGPIDAGFFGIYWSSSLYSGYPGNAYCLRFAGSGYADRPPLYRYNGFSVRPVCP